MLNEYWFKLLDYYDLYFEQCPVAPYTFYVLDFVFWILLLALFWHKVRQVKALRVENAKLKQKPVVVGDALHELVRSLVNDTLGVVRQTQVDTLNRMHDAHINSLNSINDIVASFNSANNKIDDTVV